MYMYATRWHGGGIYYRDVPYGAYVRAMAFVDMH